MTHNIPFTAWRGCSCVHIADHRRDLPERCPCHGGLALGTDTLPDRFKRGHFCDPEDAR